MGWSSLPVLLCTELLVKLYFAKLLLQKSRLDCVECACSCSYRKRDKSLSPSLWSIATTWECSEELVRYVVRQLFVTLHVAIVQ